MPAPTSRSSSHPARPLTDVEIDELQRLLDAVPAPLEPFDVSMLDGFLCGLLVQPETVPPRRWLPHVTDADGRALPAGFDTRRLVELTLHRHAELGNAIARRQWFDPWVFELDADTDADGAGEAPDADAPPAVVDAVYPWVAGFATALTLFPDLTRGDPPALNEPLALLYRHLAPDDLEDADDLLELIESLEPAADLAEAVEGLVRATLLLADVSRPFGAPAARRRPATARRR